jgi:hypothetical protein
MHHPIKSTFATLGDTLGLAVALAVPAAAQQVRVEPAPPGDLRLVDVHVMVTDLATNRTATYELGQHVPLAVGDRVRIDLAGSAIIDGTGRRVALPADFTEGGGGWRLDISPTRQGGVVVHAVQPNEADRGRGDQPSHIQFDLRADVEPRRFNTGGVTFEIAPRAAVVETPETRGISEGLARDLAHVLLVDSPRVEQSWVDRIERGGEAEARTLARQLATQAAQNGRLSNMPPWEVTAHLYRHLLGRQGSAAALWRQDTGFRGNLELLEDRGYPALVDAVLASQEFRGRHQLDRLPSGTLARPRLR